MTHPSVLALAVLLLCVPSGGRAGEPSEEEEVRRWCPVYAEDARHPEFWRDVIRRNHAGDGRALFPRFPDAMAAFREDRPEEGLRLLAELESSPVITDADWDAVGAIGALRWLIRSCDPHWVQGMPPAAFPRLASPLHTRPSPDMRAEAVDGGELPPDHVVTILPMEGPIKVRPPSWPGTWSDAP